MICKRFVRELPSEPLYKNDRGSMVVKRNGQPRRISHVSESPSDPCDPDGADKGGSETTYSFPRQSVTWPSDVNNPTRTKRLCGSPRGDPRSPHTLLIFYFLVPRLVLPRPPRPFIPPSKLVPPHLPPFRSTAVVPTRSE